VAGHIRAAGAAHLPTSALRERISRARSVSLENARAAGPPREADFSRCSFLPDVTISRTIITRERERQRDRQWSNARYNGERTAAADEPRDN